MLAAKDLDWETIECSVSYSAETEDGGVVVWMVGGGGDYWDDLKEKPHELRKTH